MGGHVKGPRASAARAYHEQYEGYSKGDAQSRLIVSHVTLQEFMNGDPPCHAKFEDLTRSASRTPAQLNYETRQAYTEKSSGTVFP